MTPSCTCTDVDVLKAVRDGTMPSPPVQDMAERLASDRGVFGHYTLYWAFLRHVGRLNAVGYLNNDDTVVNSYLTSAGKLFLDPPTRYSNGKIIKRFEHAGVSLSLADWALRLGVTRGFLQKRLEKGWSVQRALSTPKGRPYGRHKPVDK